MLEVAAAENLALSERHIPEVAACGAALHPTEGSELTVINERPLLDKKIMRTSTAVLVLVNG